MYDQVLFSYYYSSWWWLSAQQNVAARINEEGPDGLLKDIDVIDIDEPIKASCESRSRDIDVFFSVPYPRDGKKVRDCNACTYIVYFLF